MRQHIGALVVVVGILASAGAARGRETPQVAPGDGVLSVDAVARALLDRRSVVDLTPAGVLKHKIEENAAAFALPGGGSPAVLFKLPEYKGAYELEITSLCKCVGFSKRIFVPSGALLDAALRPTREIAEAEFVPLAAGRKPYRVAVTITIDDTRQAERFLLLFTNGDRLGEAQGRVKTATSEHALIKLPIRANRALTGTLEIETKPKP